MKSPYLHLGGHLYAAIDVETTGTVPHYNDIIQVAVIPLDYNFNPTSDILPFLMDIIPKRPDNVDWEAMRINKIKLCGIMLRGVEAYRAADLFMEWFQRLNLGFNKRITPVGANYVFDRGFLMDWLGPETYSMAFNSDFRDVLSIAAFRNDCAKWHDDPIPHQQCSLKRLCSDYNIERTKSHDATDDARVTAEVYKHLVKESKR